jgi:NAD(P) transhydrogenase subunit beta
VLKRGQGTGYSGIENPLFYKENARMLFGDAKKSLDELLTRIH